MDSDVQARALRRRVAEQVKRESKEQPEQQEVIQASAPTDFIHTGTAL